MALPVTQRVPWSFQLDYIICHRFFDSFLVNKSLTVFLENCSFLTGWPTLQLPGTRTRVLGCPLQHPPVYDLLEHTKRPVLQSQRCMIYTAKQQDIQKEFQGGTKMDSAVEPRGLEPEQWPCNGMWTEEFTEWLSGSPYSFRDEIPLPFAFLYFLSFNFIGVWGGGC